MIRGPLPGESRAGPWDNVSHGWMVEIGAIQLFVRVAELRSFRAAGDALGVPRSTVSRRIADLESALGTRLFHRTTRRVELTSAGKTYLRACGPALETIMGAGRALATRSEGTAGRLRVTAPVTLAETLLGEAVAECLARHPHMQLELVLTDRHVNLVEEKFDLAFRTGTLRDTSVVARELGRAQLRCFASREYLRDRGTPLAPRDLRRHDCILFPPLAPRGRWRFRSRGRVMEVSVRGRLVVNSLPLAIEAAARGLGVARLPGTLVTEGLAANQLVEVLDAYAPPAQPIYAVYAGGGRISPAARAFLEIARRHLERLGGQAAPTQA
jgi:DNA-binding transcriptional LysR family regulator